MQSLIVGDSLSNSREQLKPPKLHRSGENSFKQHYQLAKRHKNNVGSLIRYATCHHAQTRSNQLDGNRTHTSSHPLIPQLPNSPSLL